MKKTWVKVILAVLLVLLLPAIFVCAEVRMPVIYGETYYAELSEMHTRLAESEGKRIIVVGGSNVAFGINGDLLQSILKTYGHDYTVCPFGLYAAVGTSAMLELSQDEVREGDIVIFSFEPSSETMAPYFGATAFLKCAEEDPSLLTKVSKDHRKALLGNYMGYLSERFRIVQSGNYPKAEGVYARSSFNENCTMTYDRAGNTMALGFDITEPIDLDRIVIDEAFKEQVNEYYRQAVNRGASVYLTFCPMNRSALTDASAETVLRFFTMMNDTFACRIISDPNDSIMDSGWFYDSNVHLNSAGMDYHTILLAQDLLAELGVYAPVAAEYPDMPASIAVQPGNDDRANAAYFTFEEAAEGAGWCVSGLTEEGLSKTALSIPASFEEKPVVMIKSDALKGASSLQELRIPETIRELPDRLFVETPALTRLVLLHTASICSITAHTFDRADQVRVYVPEASYTMYRDGYGCESNPWEGNIDRIYTY